MKSLRAARYLGVLCSAVFLIAWHHRPLINELFPFIHAPAHENAEDKSTTPAVKPLETGESIEATSVADIALGSTNTTESGEPKPVRVQPLEEREDAMLYEIEALHNMPFEDAVTMPFDSI